MNMIDTADVYGNGQKAEKAMVAIVQSALKNVANLIVTGFEVRLSDTHTKQVHQSLLKRAIADARESAAAAEAILSARSVRPIASRAGAGRAPTERARCGRLGRILGLSVRL